MEEHKVFNEWLRYDEVSGHLFWRKPKGAMSKMGIPIGAKHKRGYLQFTFNDKKYKNHRVAWFIKKGKWPIQIDHINHIRDDNSWGNLREVNNQRNSRNQSKPKHNTSGAVGVYSYGSKGRFRALIKVNGKSLGLGTFDKFEDAVIARAKANLKYNFHANHGNNKVAN